METTTSDKLQRQREARLEQLRREAMYEALARRLKTWTQSVSVCKFDAGEYMDKYNVNRQSVTEKTLLKAEIASLSNGQLRIILTNDHGHLVFTARMIADDHHYQIVDSSYTGNRYTLLHKRSIPVEFSDFATFTSCFVNWLKQAPGILETEYHTVHSDAASWFGVAV